MSLLTRWFIGKQNVYIQSLVWLVCVTKKKHFLPVLCVWQAGWWEYLQASQGCPGPGCYCGMEEVEAFPQVCGPDAPLWQWPRHWACAQGSWATSSECSQSAWSPESWGPSFLMPAGAGMPQRWRCCPRCLLPNMSLVKGDMEIKHWVAEGNV